MFVQKMKDHMSFLVILFYYHYDVYILIYD